MNGIRSKNYTTDYIMLILYEAASELGPCSAYLERYFAIGIFFTFIVAQ